MRLAVFSEIRGQDLRRKEEAFSVGVGSRGDRGTSGPDVRAAELKGRTKKGKKEESKKRLVRKTKRLDYDDLPR